MKKPALGKGLHALISELSLDKVEAENSITELPLTKIVPNKLQPRKNFDKEALEELASSIKENGIIQPIVVNPIDDDTYQIIVGERRFRASQLAGLVSIPAIIKKSSDEQIFTWAILENIQREDLTSIEVAIAYSELMNKLNLTQDSLAKKIGKSRSSVANILRLLKLPDSIQSDIISGRLSEGHARSLASLAHIDEQVALRDEILNNKLTVRDVENRIAQKKQVNNSKLEEKNIITKDFKYIASEIEENLDIKVKILTKDAKKGKVELYFSNPDEFERLKTLLTKENSFWI